MRARNAIAVLLVAASLPAGVAALAGDPKLPASLASYHAWKALTPAPRKIPYQLAQLCAAMRLTANAATHDPHADRWVMVYANAIAAASIADPALTTFPAGTIIAKEKRIQPDAAHPEGIAFMLKHRPGEFAASAGWEFVYFPAAGTTTDYSGCISCHRGGGAKDYVFGRYATPDARP